METEYVCRLILAVPAGAKATAIVNWLNANIGASTVPDTLGPGLNATGLAADPAAYCWCNVALTEPQAKQTLARLCTLASRPTPTTGQWDNATAGQRRAWWNSVRAAVLSGYGVWCQLADNDGVWDDPAALLSLRGLKVMSPELPA